MVERGYPEDAIVRRMPPVLPIVEPVVEPKEVVKYVYYPLPTERIQLDPNTALLILGIVAAIGVISLAVIYKK